MTIQERYIIAVIAEKLERESTRSKVDGSNPEYTMSQAIRLQDIVRELRGLQ